MWPLLPHNTPEGVALTNVKDHSFILYVTVLLSTRYDPGTVPGGGSHVNCSGFILNSAPNCAQRKRNFFLICMKVLGG